MNQAYIKKIVNYITNKTHTDETTLKGCLKSNKVEMIIHSSLILAEAAFSCYELGYFRVLYHQQIQPEHLSTKYKGKDKMVNSVSSLHAMFTP